MFNFSVQRFCCHLRQQGRALFSSEFSFPVPWGHIAGKQWGDANGEPWICVHGWLDNCGSFDRLAAYFPKEKNLICFDVPGHGFSSHYPPGMMYHHAGGMSYIRRVANHFKLDKFNLMGHSMGGSMSMLYTATFPETVEKLVMLDILKPMSRDREDVVCRTREALDGLFDVEEKLISRPAKVYPTYEAARERLEQGTRSVSSDEDAMTGEALECLLKRGVKEVEGGYVFTRDLKHNVRSLYGYPTDVIAEFARQVKCPHLVIKSTRCYAWESEEAIQMILKVYEASNPENFTIEEVVGGHNVHMNDPERIWSVIQLFISKHQTRTRNYGSKL